MDRRGNEIYIYLSFIIILFIIIKKKRRRRERKEREEKKGYNKNTTTHHTKKKKRSLLHVITIVCHWCFVMDIIHYSTDYYGRRYGQIKKIITLCLLLLSASTFSMDYVITVLHVFPIDYQKRYLMRYNTTTLTVAIHTMDHRSVFIIYLFIIL